MIRADYETKRKGKNKKGAKRERMGLKITFSNIILHHTTYSLRYKIKKKEFKKEKKQKGIKNTCSNIT